MQVIKIFANFLEMLGNTSKIDGWAEQEMATWGEKAGRWKHNPGDFLKSPPYY